MSPPPSESALPAAQPSAGAEFDFSCRLPLLVMFISAAVWLIIASVFGLLASLTFHAPALLAGTPELTYGRLRAVYDTAFLYGFCIQGGLAVLLWIFVRLGRNRLAQAPLITIGAAFWNFGVTVGVAAIVSGFGTGFRYLQMPEHAAALAFLGYLLVALWAVLTFHRRSDYRLFASQWFLFAALFWFPWIYSTANLLLLAMPVRGVAQSVIDWWYSDNLLMMWLSLVGLGAVFYFVPKLTRRELHSHYLALFTFWVLLLIGGWGGIPVTAPVPAWMPTVSTVATVLLVLPLIAVGLNIYRTCGRVLLLARNDVPLSFVLIGVAAFLLSGLMRITLVLLNTDQELQFTWFAAAQNVLHSYGFFTMVIFGAAYYILPRVTSVSFPFAGMVRVHFWLALSGVFLMVVPWTIGGALQAVQLHNPEVPFINIVKSMLPFLRASTMGDLLLLLGHIIFLFNLVSLVVRLYRTPALAAYAEATADLFKPAGAKS